jgi:anti-sigma28 factor (negative regulator of flagellin synthesis)
MSLAMSAAPFDTNDNQNQNQNQNYNSYSNDSAIHKKRTSHNKTQKHVSHNEFNQEKVNSVLASIHNGSHDDDNVDNYNPKGIRAPAVQDFKPLNPIQPPESMRQEGMQNNAANEGDDLAPKPVEQENLNLQNLQSNFMNDAQVRDYYRKLVPNYNHNGTNNAVNNKQYASNNNANANVDNHTLVEKLNYMINLLEEQQDQKTNNVTEEVVLYSFLGIFIIFVVDSFARVGKYVR